MGEEVSFNGLLVVCLVAVAVPIVVVTVRGLRVPGPVLEIVAGIVIGPSVLGWVTLDPPVEILGLVGLAFVLFLAGLEIDLMRLRGALFRLALLGFGASLALGLAAGGVFRAAGWVSDPVFLAVTLSATSLGLVVPVLKDAGLGGSTAGQLAIAGATVADFGAIILLSLLFSGSEGGTASKVTAVAAFTAVAVVAATALGRAERSARVGAVLLRLSGTTAEIRVRIAVALLVAFVALAAHAGLETILGAFIAGVVLNLVDRDTMSHPGFRSKLDGIGYGFVIPVFFVSSGLRFDLDALTASPSALLRVPLFLLALLAVRALPAFVYGSVLTRRQIAVVGLLQATSLPFIVTAASVGMTIGAVDPVNGSALIAAGLLSVVVFPLVALGLSAPAAGGSAAAAAARPAEVVSP